MNMEYSEYKYTSKTRRLFSSLLEGLVVGAIGFSSIQLFFSSGKEIFILSSVIFSILFTIYRIYFIHKFGATIGGLMLGIKFVTESDNKNLSLKKSTEYFIYYSILGLINEIIGIVRLSSFQESSFSDMNLDKFSDLYQKSENSLLSLLVFAYIVFNIWHIFRSPKKQMWYDKKMGVICVRQ